MKNFQRICALLLAGALSATFFAGCRQTVPDEGNTPPDTGTPSQPTQPIETGKPKFSGVIDVTVAAGTFFNYLAGVTATASSGADLTARVSVSGEVNTAKEGTYSLTYAVTDDDGNSSTAVRKVIVSNNPALGEEKPVPVYGAETAFNIAKGCAGSATHTANGSEADALDGNPVTRWESDHGRDEVNFTVDLGAVLPVEGVTLAWESAYATQYNLYYSLNGTDYLLLAEGTAPVKESENRFLSTFTFTAPVEARYVRLACTRRVTGYGYSLWEFEVYGKQSTQVPEQLYPVLYEANGGVDDEQWLLFDLGSKKTFDNLNVKQVDWKSPASYEMLYSDTDTQEGWEQASAQGQKFTLQYGTGKLLVNGAKEPSAVSARYVKFCLHKRSFSDYSYIWQTIEIKNGRDALPATVTASSEEEGFEAENLTNETTPWRSAYPSDVQLLSFAEFSHSNRKEGTLFAKLVDLGEVKGVGRVDLTWRGDDGGKGKYYDVQISTDGAAFETVFRQTHGDRQNQSVYVYRDARYLRILDYQNTSTTSFMLEGIVVNSQYPKSSGEGKVDYDVSVAFPEQKVISYGNGSYVTGGTDFPSSRLIAYLDDSLRGKPVPSNDWWQGLLVRDKGYNMFMNPLTATFQTDGLWLTNPGEGYFSGAYPGNGSQTVNVDVHDVRIGYAGMRASAEVRVKDFSDYGITAVMTDDKRVDKLTVFLAEGTLYAYCLFAEPERATLWAENLVGAYDLSGQEILLSQGESFTGDAIVLCVRTHSGYKGGFQQYKEGNALKDNEKEYEERYYVVSVPQNTQFIRGESAISVVMKNGNCLSVGAMSGKTKVTATQAAEAGAHGTFALAEAELLHEHGYAFVVGTNASYAFDSVTNEVSTAFTLQTVLVRSGYSAEAYSAYLPHHTQNSAFELPSGYSYASVRGDCTSYAGNRFAVSDTFYGVVPTFTEPDDDGYSASVLYAQLLMLYKGNGGDDKPSASLISGDPYWQGKNLHPMSMAALAADQIGASDLREGFLDKIEYILTDWFTYDPVADAKTGAYFYYDSEWGTLYYKNSEFGAGVNLADHYFTYGYYTLAAGVLCSYRPAFAQKFGNMVELLIRDYMNPNRDDEMFPYMRNFDMFSGHGWAGGYADNNGGNNQESAGEALNSWVGAYLYASAVGNEEVRLAAIYGFTTELSAIKHYWFNYYGDFAECYPYGIAGQVYGASNFYGTFFNGEPLYMYGIHLIPGQEYLTAYAYDEDERGKLAALIENLREEQAMWEVDDPVNNTVHAWQHIFIPIVAIYDAEEAIEWYGQTLASQGNVGNDSEQFNVYYLIHGMNSAGVRTKDIWAENGATATVYQKSGKYSAVCWNPTPSEKRIVFRNKSGVVGSALLPACSLVSVDPTQVTETFTQYTDSESVRVSDCSAVQNATLQGEELVFAQGGSATYLLACGTQEKYLRILFTGSVTDAKLYIDGKEHPLKKTADGYGTDPITLTFKHELKICASGGALRGINFETVELQKLSLAGAAATASSHDGNNVAEFAIDGDMATRWESIHGNDDEWIVVELPQAVTVYQMQIWWEAASAAEYEVYFSQTGKDDDWTKVCEASSSLDGARCDTVTPSQIIETRFIKIAGIKRKTNYGYSIYELALYGV